MKNVFILLSIIIFTRSWAQNNNHESRAIEPIETAYDTIRIANEKVEYEITILELGFESWLATQFPMSFYSNETLAVRNYRMVTEWNMRVLDRFVYDPLLYSQAIDYMPNIDYGMEVNYMLYMYFKFFQQKYDQRLGSFQS